MQARDVHDAGKGICQSLFLNQHFYLFLVFCCLVKYKSHIKLSPWLWASISSGIFRVQSRLLLQFRAILWESESIQRLESVLCQLLLSELMFFIVHLFFKEILVIKLLATCTHPTSLYKYTASQNVWQLATLQRSIWEKQKGLTV